MLDEILDDVDVSAFARFLKERHAVGVLDPEVGLVVDEEPEFVEVVVGGEIPGQGVGAERAVESVAVLVRFVSTPFFHEPDDGAEFGELGFSERFLFGELVETFLRRQGHRLGRGREGGDRDEQESAESGFEHVVRSSGRGSIK